MGEEEAYFRALMGAFGEGRVFLGQHEHYFLFRCLYFWPATNSLLPTVAAAAAALRLLVCLLACWRRLLPIFVLLKLPRRDAHLPLLSSSLPNIAPPLHLAYSMSNVRYYFEGGWHANSLRLLCVNNACLLLRMFKSMFLISSVTTMRVALLILPLVLLLRNSREESRWSMLLTFL